MKTQLAVMGAMVFALMSRQADAGTAVNLKAGTLGIGGGVSQTITSWMNARVEGSFFRYGRTGELGLAVGSNGDSIPLAYNANATLFSIGALADFFPFQNGFRLTAGLYYNGNQASFSGQAARTVTFSSVDFSPAQIGNLSGQLRMGNPITPYAGIGWGNSAAPNKRFTFLMELGVMYLGPPRLAMQGSGMVGPNAENAPVVQSNLSWAQWYPNLNLGFGYRLF